MNIIRKVVSFEDAKPRLLQEEVENLIQTLTNAYSESHSSSISRCKKPEATRHKLQNFSILD